MKKAHVKLAILDMNNGEPNQGLRCIKEIVTLFEEDVDYQIFDVRSKQELPDSSFDIYISSGGPGSPLDKGAWRKPYLHLMQELWDFNKQSDYQKKHVFFICYSFQVMCDYFELGSIKPRRSTSFGILPIHKTKAGLKDTLLEGLSDPFFAVDSRDWQLIQPRLKVFKEHGASILSLEKLRSHVEYERAIMAVRFSKEFVGTQFHPEADPIGMKAYFLAEENKRKVITNFGEEKYENMMTQMDDPEKITLTYNTILPKFIGKAIKQVSASLIS
ncbi:GMP synthase [Subsaximicrobium wynnwilliamsii]|uniref:GMP synthase n=1 Tax=Subsaximicrobium wynnwilliamsii TaxID=291179 RepID=A0A5C6ZHF8_9FLAO|nr:GMP synthase [Subsaximicrobium wynnwilliamsii]TXD83320.1 GMP synthase [Subsaximicrobium wynnwilliamsii]TXD89143.1 GMP synthase [Subsaximicrobium wynnwilliamsii]TXE03344.1 GMP synthase [Subsaximicrobium wynnwilliamsii]